MGLLLFCVLLMVSGIFLLDFKVYRLLQERSHG